VLNQDPARAISGVNLESDKGVIVIEDSDEVPAKFYKYRSMSGAFEMDKVKGIVVGNEIYFASAATFNDPFDLRPVFSLDASPERQREDFLRLSRKFNPQRTEAQHLADADQAMIDALSQENIPMSTAVIQTLHNQLIRDQVGVFCVSTKRDDILMWAHYADSHRGICLEFDGLSTLMAHAQKVKYSGERVAINPFVDGQRVMMEKSLLTKSAHWSYEDEWRLIRYERGPGVVEYRPHNLTGIILGAFATQLTVEKVREWVGQRKSPVDLYRARVSDKKFELMISSI
jgi:hypothetical protein